MLQISSGKFFSRNKENSNQLRGIIYTNLTSIRGQTLETAAGTLTATDGNYGLNAFIYEFTEYVTPSPPASRVVASYGIGSLILDFSSILSFSLNCTSSPDYSLTERIVGDQAGATTQYAPKKMVKKVFDQEAICSNEDIEHFIEFTKHLIGLERNVYLGVIRSIRTYVTAMQRIADDFELAYTLLVASLESLAQDFDCHQSKWADYEPKKRKSIDTALINTDDTTANKVREAILAHEHTSLAKRFKEFSINHINPDFYREKATDIVNPISKLDLPIALNHAYQARSKYVHTLEKLPYQVSRPTGYSELCIVEDRPWLTLQGLSRLAREVIINFTMQQNTLEREDYDYQLEIPNIVQFKLPPSYWIHQINFTDGAGRKKLEGFLFQLSDCMLRKPNSSITNLTELLEELEIKIPSLTKDNSYSFIALYILYHWILKTEYNEKINRFIKKYEKEILNSSIESLIIYNLLPVSDIWKLETHNKLVFQYFTERNNKNRIRYPQLFETSILLQLAERYRKNSDHEKALNIIEQAVENYPGYQPLLQFEKNYKSHPNKIDWEKILLPPKE